VLFQLLIGKQLSIHHKTLMISGMLDQEQKEEWKDYIQLLTKKGVFE
jgi:hypothetical protein